MTTAPVLIGLCYFAGACVMAALTVDIAITTYHRVTGSPTAQKVLEEMVKSSQQTIHSMRTTINAQQSEIRVHKRRLEEMEKRLEEAEKAAQEGRNDEV